MTTLNIVALVVWLMAGISNLLTYSNQEGVSKLSYIACWLSLLVYIVAGFFQ